MSFSIGTSISSTILSNSSSIGGPDDEYEEALVYVRFEDFADANFFFESKEIVIHNIEGSTPRCFVDGFRFAGTHSINLGTMLFFEKKNIPGDLSEVEFTGSTDTTLEFSLRSIPIVEKESAELQENN